MKPLLLILFAFLPALFPQAAAEDKPITVLAVPGRQLLLEDFTAPLPPPKGSTAHFASGFEGWRFNVVPRGGRWQIGEGAFRGVEDPAMHHPATACYGFPFRDVIVQCEVRLHDVPLAGRPRRFFMLRTTDAKDYVCSVVLDEKGFRIQKDDNDHGGPDKSELLAQAPMPLPLEQWHTVTLEILGDEMAGTVDGKPLTGRHRLIGSDKHSIMLVSGGETSVRRLRIWEASAISARTK